MSREYSPVEQLLSADLDQQDLNIKRRDIVYDGFFKMRKFSLQHRQFEGGWTEEFQRELFCRGDAVWDLQPGFGLPFCPIRRG